MEAAVVLVSMLALDFVWIYCLNLRRYMDEIEAIQGRPPQISAAAAVCAYACLFGILYLYAVPAARNASPELGIGLASISVGAPLGLLVYGMYNFTTKALLEDYSWPTACLDTLWGGACFSLVCLCALSLEITN